MNLTGEASIHTAYLQAIAESQHYVWIENQFFVSGLGPDDALVANHIADALYHRIVRAVEAHHLKRGPSLPRRLQHSLGQCGSIVSIEVRTPRSRVVKTPLACPSPAGCSGAIVRDVTDACIGARHLCEI